MTPRILTQKEAADMLQVHPETMPRLRKNGLKFKRIGDGPRAQYRYLDTWIIDYMKSKCLVAQ
jgi:hypothetical protein